MILWESAKGNLLCFLRLGLGECGSHLLSPFYSCENGLYTQRVRMSRPKMTRKSDLSKYLKERTEGRKGYSQEADSRGTVGGRAEGRQGPMGKEVLRLQALGEETNAVDDNCNRCTRRVRSVGKL